MYLKTNLKIKNLALTAVCCITASMLLSGCGGSGGSSDDNKGGKVTVTATVDVSKLDTKVVFKADSDTVLVDIKLTDSSNRKVIDLGSKTASINDGTVTITKDIDSSSDTYQVTIPDQTVGNATCSLEEPTPNSYKLNKSLSINLKYNCSTTPPIHLPAKVQTYKGNIFHGVNLAGADFYNGIFSNTKPNDSGKIINDDAYHFVPYAQDGSLFYLEGANTVRIPILWEYLLGPKWDKNNYTKIDTGSLYWTHIKDLLTNLAKIKGLNVILDMHDYMRFNYDLSSDSYNNPASTNIIGTSGNPTTSDYAAIWKNIETQVHQLDPKNQISFELMNEPWFMKTTTAPTNSTFDTLVATNYDAAITAISGLNKKRKIIVDGSHWSGLHSWSTDIGDDATGGSRDPIDILIKQISHKQIPGFEFSNLIVDVHQYFNVPKPGHTPPIPEFSGHYTSDGCKDYSADIPNWVSDIDEWSQKNYDIKWMVGEMGVPQYANAKANDGLNATCQKDVTALYTDARKTNSFQGFTIWKAGHAWGPATYMNIQPGAVKSGVPSGATAELIGSHEPNDQMYSNNKGFYSQALGFVKLVDTSWLPTFTNSKYYIKNSSNYDLFATYPNRDNGELTHEFQTPFSSIIQSKKIINIDKSIFENLDQTNGGTIIQFTAFKTNNANDDRSKLALTGLGYEQNLNAYKWAISESQDIIQWYNTNCDGQKTFCADVKEGLFSTIVNAK